MKNAAACLLACAFLLGCSSSSNPFATEATTEDGATTDGTTDNGTTGSTGGSVTANNGSAITVPSSLAGNVTSVTFNPQDGTLTVEGANLDNSPVHAAYTRAPHLDQNGYVAFVAQADALDRHFTGYAKETGTVRAAVIASPGPRNRSFLGVHFDRDGAFDAPDVSNTSGQVSYAGKYQGLTNVGDPTGGDLISTTVTPSELQPTQALLVSGDVLLNANFADNTVEGNIFNRELLNTDQTKRADLPSLVMTFTTIDSRGTFEGAVEYDIRDPNSNTTSNTVIGSYGGVFGGTDAAEVAGGIQLDEFDGAGDPLGMEAELESGVFVLDKCGTAGASPLCDQLNSP